MAALRLARVAFPLVASQLATLAASAAASQCRAAAPFEDSLEQEMSMTLLQIELGNKAESAAAAGDNPVNVIATGFREQIAGLVAPGAEAPVPKDMQKAMESSGMEEAPGQLLEVLGQANSPEEQEFQQRQQSDQAAQQQTASWIAAMFSDKPAGEAIDGTNAEEVVGKLTGYVMKEAEGAKQEGSVGAAQDLPEWFFTENRLKAIEKMAMEESALAVAAANDRQTKVADTGVDSTHGAHSGYTQKFDLEPEPGREEEAGQKWHIELSHNQDVSANAISIMGRGSALHYLQAK